MLKSELEKEYGLIKNLLEDKYVILNRQSKEIKELLKCKDELAHHEKTKDQVCQLIDSLSVVLCPESVKYQRLEQDVHRMSENDRAMYFDCEVKPESQLFDAMQEIKTRLMNSGLNNLTLL